VTTVSRRAPSAHEGRERHLHVGGVHGVAHGHPARRHGVLQVVHDRIDVSLDLIEGEMLLRQGLVAPSLDAA
jgi:hypothetical protein